MGAAWAGTIDLHAGQGARVAVQFSTPTYPADVDGTLAVQPLGISETVSFREDRIQSAETVDDHISGIALSGARVDGIYQGEMQIAFVADATGAQQVDISMTGDVVITSATLMLV